jgi:hypothetical protein
VQEAAALLPLAVRVGLAGAGAVLVLAAVIAGHAPPSPERQVDHRWLDVYRGWVVGVGFGFQLGAGVFTRISSYAFYLLVLSALLGASREGLVLAALAYAGVRAFSAAPGGRIRTPYDLQRITTLMARRESRIAAAGRAADLTGAAGMLAVAVVAGM